MRLPATRHFPKDLPHRVIRLVFLAVSSFALTSCTREESLPAMEHQTLAEARRGFKTRLLQKVKLNEPTPLPPAGKLIFIKYPSTIGDMGAYISPPLNDSRRHPAIIWIIGGFGNGISEESWTRGEEENDQSATVFSDAGIPIMYPSLRGGNENPGYLENFYGEVDDVAAAAGYLSKLDYVDPARIYLGGHSTGGTLALLTAEYTNCFRAIFSFGPVNDVRGYGNDVLVFNINNEKEALLRAPGPWLMSIRAPVFVFEGTKPGSNISSLHELAQYPHHSTTHFYPVPPYDHLSILRPVSKLIAQQILRDTGTNVTMSFGRELK